jgi:S-formylglutathione hydrolase FrmB
MGAEAAMETISTVRSFGGVQGVYRHASAATGTPMTFSVYVPPQARERPVPVVWYLSGLTCTHANVTEKAGFQRVCAELGLMFVAPDTSPRRTTRPTTSGRARASTSTRRKRPGRRISACGAT